ncbi:DUF4307 domain-containing protein [Streptomyces fuscigenes]|uniref:DUF4307 domain-containing protein n=1 Tax=Streptomyces fuscigenes TaxID=1528880 RepID=UPI001F45A233|nr:DUF4307 domain-containing protein [Streptomyces fuscigenes]MCF3963500.1 DUF4307 domain-containing protein [Streptomyces fuscigenes]
MAQVRTQAPAGRYGRSADERADRKLKIVGSVLGAAAVIGLGYYGFHTIADQSVSGQVVSYEQVTPSEVHIHLEVNKGKSTTGSCTVRALDTDHNEVGRKTVRYDQPKTQIDQIITLRTTARSTAAELVGCSDG